MAALELLSALGSAASMISLADTMAKSEIIERRSLPDAFGKTGPFMAGVRNLAKAIPAIRRAARDGVSRSEVSSIEALPNSAVQALTQKAVEAEQSAANQLAEMDGIDRFAVMRITDKLRADMCTILEAISDLSGGSLPAPLAPKWNEFKCAA